MDDELDTDYHSDRTYREHVEDELHSITANTCFRDFDARDVESEQIDLPGAGRVDPTIDGVELFVPDDGDPDEIFAELIWKTNALRARTEARIETELVEAPIETEDTLTAAMDALSTDATNRVLLAPRTATGIIGTTPYACRIGLVEGGLPHDRALVADADRFGHRTISMPVVADEYREEDHHRDVVRIRFEWSYDVTDPDAARWIDLT